MSNRGQDRKGKVVYPARDARWQYGGPGVGAKPRPRAQSQVRAQPPREVKEAKIGGPDCSICTGVCCTVARAFVEEVFALGATNLSPKVSFGIRYGLEVNISYVFRLSIKYYAMRTALLKIYV